MTFPSSLQGILWSKDIKNIDYYEDRNYIINQILAYGDMDEIKWLLKTYPIDEIKDIFKNYPARIYTRPVFLFIKEFVLEIKKKLNEDDYVKNITG
jgi:hypothetical protein